MTLATSRERFASSWGPITARGLSVASTFGMTAVVSRRLAPEDAGKFFVLMAIMIAASTVGRWGTDTYALKAAASKGLSRDGFRHLGMICAAFAGICALGAPLVGVVVLQLSWETLLPTVAPSMIVASWSSAMSVFFGSTIRGFGRVSSGVLIETGWAPFITLVIVLVDSGLHLLGELVVVYAIGNVSALLIGFISVVRSPWVASVSAYETTTAAARQSRRSMMGSAALFYMLTWAPVITLGYLSMSREAAYFSVAARLANIINLVPILQNSYIAPQLARAHSRGEVELVGRIAQSAARKASIVAIPAAVALVSSPWLVVRLFGADYGAAVPAMRILVIGVALVIAAGPVNPVMLTCGLERLSVVLNALLLCATISGIWALAPRGGVTVVALVSALATCMYALVAMTVLAKRDGIRTAVWSRT